MQRKYTQHHRNWLSTNQPTNQKQTKWQQITANLNILKACSQDKNEKVSNIPIEYEIVSKVPTAVSSDEHDTVSNVRTAHSSNQNKAIKNVDWQVLKVRQQVLLIKMRKFQTFQ